MPAIIGTPQIWLILPWHIGSYMKPKMYDLIDWEQNLLTKSYCKSIPSVHDATNIFTPHQTQLFLVGVFWGALFGLVFFCLFAF